MVAGHKRMHAVHIYCQFPGYFPMLEFVFQEEQLLQKQSKRGRARIVTIGSDFSGTCCASRKYGWKVWIKQPIIDGKCLKVSAGELIVATRGISGWAYGFRETDPRNKGWFPIEVTNLKKKNNPETEETTTTTGDVKTDDTVTTEEDTKTSEKEKKVQ